MTVANQESKAYLADKLVATASGNYAVFAPRHEAIQE